MLSIWEAALLGVLQGLTEFLPVSSSGHLVVVQQLFGWHADEGVIMAFDVALHVGTLLAVLVYFERDIVDMMIGRNLRMLGFIVAATIPAAVIGLLFKDAIEGLFTSVPVVGIAWLVTGTFLWLTRYAREERFDSVGWLKSIVIGTAQALAIIPGISRSGSTIVTGMFLKLNKVMAARFSFLISIPAIAGGALLDARDIVNFPRGDVLALAVGFLTSAVTGYLAIYWLLRVVQRGKFSWFGIYCWAAGVFTLGSLLIR